MQTNQVKGGLAKRQTRSIYPVSANRAISPRTNQQQPIVVHVHQPPAPAQIVQHDQPGGYVLTKDRLPAQQLPAPPRMIQTVSALIMMVLFFAGVSMASIGLTAYSNSVNRTDRINRIIHVEQ